MGFDALKKRVAEYPLERVSAITGVKPELIRQAARLYATTKPAVIPWTPITDQQVSSTSAIRLHCTLRALTGNLDVPGGDVFNGFIPDFVSETDLEWHDVLSDEQKAKQLGSDTYPACGYRGTAALAEPTQRVWGRKYANLVFGSYMANPSAVFRAMADGTPYPVKAFFALGNNTLMGFANNVERHCGQQFVVWHIGARVFPGEGEYDALGLDDLAVDTTLPTLGALRRAHPEPIGAANAHIHLAVDRCKALRSPPARDVLGLRPGLEHKPARRIDNACDDEFAFVTACGHVASPCLAVR